MDEKGNNSSCSSSVCPKNIPPQKPLSSLATLPHLPFPFRLDRSSPGIPPSSQVQRPPTVNIEPALRRLPEDRDTSLELTSSYFTGLFQSTSQPSDQTSIQSTMDVFSELDIHSPVTSSVISSSDLVATVESALQFAEASSNHDFSMDFFSDYHRTNKDGYEGDSRYEFLPPYPEGASPSSTSSMSSSMYQPPPSPYSTPPSTFSMIQEGSKKREGQKRLASTGELLFLLF
ncbi:hypothetical protein JTE90_006055 [Oedothorax gibbosus]|uniref:Uncharacterized protein n=1 Tax=Oedothorax gibbosus TaxID=931172 RepID=A0AAV6V5F4_9ARAC|nr:hypothetical protein JTE90_006055 [Oedothorax gibbosus]